jgi:hypothetical protein
MTIVQLNFSLSNSCGGGNKYVVVIMLCYIIHSFHNHFLDCGCQISKFKQAKKFESPLFLLFKQ